MPTHYSIRETSHMTGVQPVTLRAWERRYGLLHPARTERGHRIYGDADLRRINDILYWIDQGLAISKVAEVIASADTGPGEQDRGRGSEAVRETLRALGDGNPRRLEQVLSGELALYPLPRVIDGCIEPVRHYLREASANPVARGQLALFESVVQQKLSVRLLNLAPGRGRPGVMVAPLGSPARLDLLLLALALGQRTPAWSQLEEADADAVLALALSVNASSILFCLAPSLSSSAFSRMIGRRARQCHCAVYACCPTGPRFKVMPAGITWLHGDIEAIAGQFSSAEGAMQ